MRFAVLILGILGGLASAGVGTLGLVLYLGGREAVTDPSEFARLGMTQAEVSAAQEGFKTTARTFPFLLAGLPLGLVGGVFGLLGRGKSGASLLFAAAAGPALQNPVTLIFTSLLSLGGLLSLFVRPKRPAPPKAPAHRETRPERARSLPPPRAGGRGKNS